MSLHKAKRFLMGEPLNPFKKETRQHMALITFFAWIGLGADGISSSAYGPEEAFVALGPHANLAIFLALATGFTVFIIALAYLQVIKLFPNGGGGYKVASQLLGPKAGLVSGSALIVDYILTIAISIASAIDSFFSVMPIEFQPYKLAVELSLVLLLSYMNLRGVKESIKFLMPIFLGFCGIYAVLIIYGIAMHAEGLPTLLPNAIDDAQQMSMEYGWLAVLALFFKAFSMGGGTYTGLEAVSNSVQTLAEPRVRTGRNTMLCVAASLAFMAAGIIMLYLLWDVERQAGMTMNASAFTKITSDWVIGDVNISGYVVGTAMLLTAGLLFVAANTGFIAGPAVLANMALDRWMPHFFSALSSRLVTKNGVLLMGVCAILALIITGGRVDVLVVLYSINVFLTFTLSMMGVTRYRWKNRKEKGQKIHIILPAFATLICAAILATTLIEKFAHGGWMTILITGLFITVGYLIHRHYEIVRERINQTEADLDDIMESMGRTVEEHAELDEKKSTAVFLVSGNNASGMHCFLWVLRLFPNTFHNFIFVSVGEIDTEEFVDQEKWQSLRRDTKKMLKRYVEFCHNRGMAARYYHAFGTDALEQLTKLTEEVAHDYPKSVFFATKLIFEDENPLTQLLHNQTAYMMQRRLHNAGRTMIIMPMKI